MQGHCICIHYLIRLLELHVRYLPPLNTLCGELIISLITASPYFLLSKIAINYVYSNSDITIITITALNTHTNIQSY